MEDVNLYDISLQVLQSKTRGRLASLLNRRKLTLSSTRKLYRDYRGLAELMGLRIDDWTPNKDNYIATLLEKSRHTLGQLQDFLEQIDRFDVLDDCRDMIYEDAVAHLRQVNSPIMPYNKEEMLTVDDIMESRRTYDAFLLYVEADIEFAATIVTELQSPKYNLKLCYKDRLLGGAIFEHSAIMQLISQRCNRLLVLLSDDFVDSDRDFFFLDFAQLHGLEKRNKDRFIVPVSYKRCDNLPDRYKIYHTLHYKPPSVLGDFWKILYSSIVPAQNKNGMSVPTLSLASSSETPERSQHFPDLENANNEEIQRCLSSLSKQKSASLDRDQSIPTGIRRRSIKSRLSNVFKKVWRGKSKSLSVACAS